MKGKTFVLVCVLVTFATVAPAGLFKDSVDLADLAELAPEKLESLKEIEFAVFVAQVRLNAAKAAERRADGGIKAAKRTLEAEELDLKAAQAESKAATANQDVERKTAATARIAGAEEDLATARALHKWKTKEREAREAEVEMAKAAVDLAEAQRDAARVALLQQERAPSGEKYDLADLQKQVDKRRKDHDSAARKATEKAARVDKLRVAWERIAKNTGLVETE